MSCVLKRPIVQKQIIHIIIRIYFRRYICYYVLIVVYLTSLCVIGPLKRSFRSRFKLVPTHAKKGPIYTRTDF
jgi:hypothetical protein